MPALVQSEVTTTGVGVGVVLFETVFDVVGFRLDRHPHTHAYVVGDFAPIRLQRRDHLHHALALQHTPFANRARDIRNVLNARGWIQQPIAGHA